MKLLLISAFGFCLSLSHLSAQENWLLKGQNNLAYPPVTGTIDSLNNCPKFNTFTNLNSYPDNTVKLKDVSLINSDNLPPFTDDMDAASLISALKANLAYWTAKQDFSEIMVGEDIYTAVQMRATTKKLLEIFSANLKSAEINDILKKDFKLYRSIADDGSNNVIITGYYEAQIPVSATPTEKFKYPIHLKPKDLIKTSADMNMDFDYGRIDENENFVKHYSREEIRNGKLNGQNLEIVWSAHPAEIMLLQIQGSGILSFGESGFIKAGFNGANGWPFKSVQKILMECGEIPAMNFSNFISYLSAQPTERELRLVNLNPRYIFFRINPSNTQPYGAMGKALTPGRSIAVDPKPIPYGLTAILKSKKPVAGENGNISEFKNFTRLVTTQDTGSAIRGPGRVDLFWGAGYKAKTEASSMKAKGELYLLVLK
ncbi:MAG: MltA domain-containing protein [Elusimicrobiota bacterium]|nr:MltA domain-containing protein [Elusimicrobiota bacterium]